MVVTVTQAGAHNGGLSNVGEIERLIIEKHLVMNQSSVLHPLFFLPPFTSVEDILGLFSSFTDFCSCLVKTLG